MLNFDFMKGFNVSNAHNVLATITNHILRQGAKKINI